MTHAYSGRRELAITYFHRALQESPNEPAVYSALSETHHEQGNLELAVYYAKRALAGDSTTPSYYLNLAHLQEEMDRPDSARATYAALLQQYPDHEQGLNRLAELHHEAGRLHEAVEVYEALLEISPQPSGVRSQLVQLYMQTGDDIRLIQTLNALIGARPSDKSLYELLLRTYIRHDSTQGARETLWKFLRTHPEDIWVVKGLVRRLADHDRPSTLGEYLGPVDSLSWAQLKVETRIRYERFRSNQESGKRLSALLQEMLARRPSYAEAHWMLGNVYFDQGAYERAAPSLRQAAEHGDRGTEAWVRAARAYRRGNEFQRALETAENGLNIHPDAYPLYYLAGVSAHTLGQYTSARDYLEMARAHQDFRMLDSTRRANVHSLLGSVFEKLDRWTAAEAAFTHALDTDSDYAPAMVRYARSLARRGYDLDKALALALKAVHIRPDRASYTGLVGWIYYQRNEFQEAVHWLEQAIDGNGENYTFYEHLGDAYWELDKPQKARRYWEKARNLAPTHTPLDIHRVRPDTKNEHVHP